jgi:hypothetical protein
MEPLGQAAMHFDVPSTPVHIQREVHNFRWAARTKGGLLCFVVPDPFITFAAIQKGSKHELPFGPSQFFRNTARPN